MEASPKIGTLIAGCWLTVCGIYFSLGIFLPKFRGRWGRPSQRGARLSRFSQVLWAAMLILFGTGAILSAYHFTWTDHAFPFVFFPLFAVLLFMGWRDNRKRDDKDAA
jgi:hypothetical protein